MTFEIIKTDIDFIDVILFFQGSYNFPKNLLKNANMIEDKIFANKNGLLYLARIKSKYHDESNMQVEGINTLMLFEQSLNPIWTNRLSLGRVYGLCVDNKYIKYPANLAPTMCSLKQLVLPAYFEKKLLVYTQGDKNDI